MCRKNNGTIYRYKRLPLLVLQYNDYWFEYILKKGNTFLLDKIIFYDSISWLSQKYITAAEFVLIMTTSGQRI